MLHLTLEKLEEAPRGLGHGHKVRRKIRMLTLGFKTAPKPINFMRIGMDPVAGLLAIEVDQLMMQ
jgi:hypothetical protein